jgi:hypothetical protein
VSTETVRVTGLPDRTTPTAGVTLSQVALATAAVKENGSPFVDTEIVCVEGGVEESVCHPKARDAGAAVMVGGGFFTMSVTEAVTGPAEPVAST